LYYGVPVLEELRISGLGVISDATLPLDRGFTVITGETGAGKTMVVAGLGLLFGGRADAARVRAEPGHGEPGRAEPGRAVVEGHLQLTGEIGQAVRERVEEAGAECDDDGLLLTRMVSLEGRSRAHVGGRTVPVALLGEIGEHVLALHGQSDQLRLLRPVEQRASLDRYAGPEHEKRVTAYREAFGSWCQARVALDERRRNARQRSQEADLLRLGLDEITRVDPQPGEDESLRDEAVRLEHAEGLRTAAEAAYRSLGGLWEADDASGAIGRLAMAARALEAQADVDKGLGELAGRVSEASTVVADVAAELGAYLDLLDADPARLAAVHERRATLRALTRKYADDVDGVLAWAEHARARLAELDPTDEALERLEGEVARLAGDVAELAAQLSESRRAAAGRFGDEVTAELTGLAMPHARVEIAVSARPAAGGPSLTVAGVEVGLTADGADEVEIRLRPHPGAPPLPLQKGASGGELSRVMLAIEVVFAGVGGPPTLVFDEVDAGVGGQAAVEIGRRLAQLARTHQVLAVTHLPQVAAFADRHIVVEKGTDGAVTVSGVRVVEHTARARELARMLAGLPDSDLGIAHAEELLTVVGRAKAA
jgi:DNA repair protein RecN (Recombination protein N)